MTVEFPSREWIEEYMKVLNTSPVYKEASKTREGDFLFVIEPDDKLSKKVIFYLDLWHGDCKRVDFFEKESDLPKTKDEYIGTYSKIFSYILSPPLIITEF
ncbi:MAG: hypothetical protein ACTSX6_02460 [Candidatus Heimdallarchaeaceae archaeon]